MNVELTEIDLLTILQLIEDHGFEYSLITSNENKEELKEKIQKYLMENKNE